MVEASTEREFPVASTALWAILADFGNIDWIPGVQKVELEGEGVGMIRHVTAPGLPQLHERLDSLDHASMTLDYSLPSVAYLQVKDYRARAQVEPIDAGRCRLRWSCQAVADGVDEARAVANTQGFYDMVMLWIGNYLQKRSLVPR